MKKLLIGLFAIGSLSAIADSASLKNVKTYACDYLINGHISKEDSIIIPASTAKAAVDKALLIWVGTGSEETKKGKETLDKRVSKDSDIGLSDIKCSQISKKDISKL